MAKRQSTYYPCLGYCMVDARGVCVACGRPPSLGLPEVCATAKTAPAERGVPPPAENPRDKRGN